MSTAREVIAKNIAVMLHDGDVVNLGVGIPTLVSNYIPAGIQIFLHSENGAIGVAGNVSDDTIFSDAQTFLAWEKSHKGEQSDYQSGHKDLVDAGSYPITLIPGACTFDAALSFVMSRGGHLDLAVLGAMQVDQEGNLANWMVPGQRVTGMGGAMDIASGTPHVIVATTLTTRDGKAKLKRKCELPLTVPHKISKIVTEKCIVEIKDNTFYITHLYPGISRDEVQKNIEGNIVFAEPVKPMIV
jgi:3-oxoacid CoA-transferase B subunit